MLVSKQRFQWLMKLLCALGLALFIAVILELTRPTPLYHDNGSNNGSYREYRPPVKIRINPVPVKSEPKATVIMQNIFGPPGEVKVSDLPNLSPWVWAFNLDVYPTDQLWQHYHKACLANPELEGKVLRVVETHAKVKEATTQSGTHLRSINVRGGTISIRGSSGLGGFRFSTRD